MSLEGKQILLVDRADEAEAEAAALRALGLRVSVASDPDAALLMARRDEFDMAMIGVGARSSDGGDLLARLAAGARVPSILILARPEEVREAIAALQRGASDYLIKPLTRAEMAARVERLLLWHEAELRARDLHQETVRRYLPGTLVSRSPGMQKVREQVLQVASARSTVLIIGESGVGKELVAKAIHYNSARRGAPFIAINCSAIPAMLIESELFGHEKGAFTGAVDRQRGKFELAHGGTILLDEIGEMDAAAQVKLLRVLEEREFMRVGGTRPVRVDVRVLAATNRDLKALIAAGRFREDLYFRFNVITIRVPPLRRRREDLPDLAQSLLDQICRDNGLPARRLAESAVTAILSYSWPGNVRELKNVLESTAITRPGPWVEAADLPEALRGGVAEEADAAPVGATLDDFERDLIRRTLLRHAGNRTYAAKSLGIGLRTLQRKIQRYGLRLRGTRGRPRRAQKSAETPSPGSSSGASQPASTRKPPRATSS
ncbi:MAG TPA: sigma-54 dependent transcriptional regulator [Dongiaceae bacterium]|nr:sigma-54 dependent transcriptional regulator [Dongiaceae bacterium]